MSPSTPQPGLCQSVYLLWSDPETAPLTSTKMPQHVLDRLYVPLLITGMLVTGENHAFGHESDA